MERIWAPWRLNYVSNTDNKREVCVFCNDPECTDEERFILQRGEHSIVIMNIFPYNNGHIMVAPVRHTCSLSALTGDERNEIMFFLGEWTEILKQALQCHGFNVGVNLGRIAGAGIEDHLHFHIVPRWNGDTNFMPVLADIKVIPQSLEDCYNLLKTTMEKFKDAGRTADCQ